MSRRNTIHISQSSLRSSQSQSSRFVNSKRTVAFDAKLDKPSVKKPTVQVFDDDNVDVTPRSLLGPESTSSAKSSANLNKSIINFNDSASVAAPSELLNQSLFGGSTYQASYAAGFSKSIMSSMISSRTSLDSVTDEISEPVQQTYGIQETLDASRKDTKETLSDEDLQKIVKITLDETDTICLFDIPGVSISLNDEHVDAIVENNNKYDKLCANREGNDRYVERGMQTFHNACKTKEMQTNPVLTVDEGCMATNWDLYDTYNTTEEVEEGDEVEDDLMTFTTTNPNNKALSLKTSSVGSFDTASRISQSVSAANMTASYLSESSLLSAGSGLHEESDSGSILGRAGSAVDTSYLQMEKLMKLDSFKENLFIMERTVVQNQYHTRQAAYRGFSDLKLFSVVDKVLSQEEGEGEKEENEIQPIGPNMSRLWSYECSLTRGMTATCMVWNKVNHDLLAVGYSKNGFTENGKGLICVWSVKNPEHPERVYAPSCAVTSIDFSSSHPSFLSVGLFNGTIVIYNIHSSSDKPVLDSTDIIGKHSAPVWQLKWIEKEKGTTEDRSEILVSASGDGRVTQWSISKGFEFSDLMKLKRTCPPLQNVKKGNAVKKNDGFISRYTCGMCFDFHPSDGNVYLSGTEDGEIHRCSCSYNEQYLDTYRGHKGPVYRTLWSPYNSDIFLTCSADWSVRLWHVDNLQPILSLQATTQAIIDIDWCPFSSVMFAAISEKQVEIWNLTHSILDPLIVHLPVTPHVKLTSLKFALNSTSLVVGDSDGHVTIYQLNEMLLNDGFVKDEPLLKVVQSNMPNLNPVSYQADEESNSDGSFVER